MALLAGLGTAGGPEHAAPPVGSPTAADPTRRARARRPAGWTVTVYYTAVQRFRGGPPTPVTGCTGLACADGRDHLGRFPADFVAAVRAEGTGQTADGRYLNWSHDVGFWLDESPRDAAGGVLRPWVSAAADPGVLPAGTRFAIADCGHDGSGHPIDPAVCARLRAARWIVTDEFTPGLGGPRHVDVYIGPETGPDFEQSPWYTALTGATLRIG